MKPKLILMAAALLTGIVFTGCEKELNPKEPGLLVPKTVEQDPTLPSISVNGTLLHAETFGNPGNPMIVVLHGGPGGDYRYLLKSRAFADQGYFVVFYDQRGSGLSKRHDRDTYSIQLMLDDLSAVISHYRKSANQKVFLLGQSWGAMLATAYINAYPSRINGAILSEPGGFTWSDAKNYLKRAYKKKHGSEATKDAYYFDQVFTGNDQDHELLDYKLQLAAAFENEAGNHLGNAGPHPVWRNGAVAAKAIMDIADRDGFDFTQNLKQFTTKVLFLYSAFNTAYGPEHARHVAEAYPHVQLEKINGTGHKIPYDGWNNFYPVALTYLNQLK